MDRTTGDIRLVDEHIHEATMNETDHSPDSERKRLVDEYLYKSEEIGCIVVLGMYGTGTSTVAGVLRQLGVNMGVRFDEFSPHEDLDWHDLNAQVLRLTGCTWCSPPDRQQVSSTREQIEQDLLHLISVKDCDDHLWGWSDPINCLTMDIIHECLPDPFYVNVSRNRRSIVDALRKKDISKSHDHWYNLVDRYDEAKFNFIIQNSAPFCSVNYDELYRNTTMAVTTLASVVGQRDASVINLAADMVGSVT